MPGEVAEGRSEAERGGGRQQGQRGLDGAVGEMLEIPAEPACLHGTDGAERSSGIVPARECDGEADDRDKDEIAGEELEVGAADIRDPGAEILAEGRLPGIDIDRLL